jgi:hypothetical protein
MTGKSAGDNLNECVLAGIVVRSWQWCLLGMGLIATQQPVSVYKPTLPCVLLCRAVTPLSHLQNHTHINLGITLQVSCLRNVHFK